MKKLIIVVFLLLFSNTAYAAKAAAVVTGTQSNPNSVTVSVQVTEDSGTVNFSTSFTINFTNSTNQLNANIKTRVRDELVRMGITISVNDIFLFGGAQ